VSLLDVQAYERKFKDAEASKAKASEDPKPGAVEAANAKFEKAQVEGYKHFTKFEDVIIHALSFVISHDRSHLFSRVYVCVRTLFLHYIHPPFVSSYLAQASRLPHGLRKQKRRIVARARVVQKRGKFIGCSRN
jgi:hypothetical protein